jgi:transposase
MNYRTYYENQAKNEIPVFKGSLIQRGYGFGDIFKKFFSWIVPIVKKNAVPVLKDVGKQIVKTTSNIAYDTIDGQNFKNSSKNRIGETMEYIEKQYGKGKIKYKKQRKNKKRKHKVKRLKKKATKKRKTIKKRKLKSKKNRILDIFGK